MPAHLHWGRDRTRGYRGGPALGAGHDRQFQHRGDPQYPIPGTTDDQVVADRQRDGAPPQRFGLRSTRRHRHRRTVRPPGLAGAQHKTRADGCQHHGIQRHPHQAQPVGAMDATPQAQRSPDQAEPSQVGHAFAPTASPVRVTLGQRLAIQAQTKPIVLPTSPTLLQRQSPIFRTKHGEGLTVGDKDRSRSQWPFPDRPLIAATGRLPQYLLAGGDIGQPPTAADFAPQQNMFAVGLGRPQCLATQHDRLARFQGDGQHPGLQPGWCSIHCPPRRQHRQQPEQRQPPATGQRRRPARRDGIATGTESGFTHRLSPRPAPSAKPPSTRRIPCRQDQWRD